MSLPQPPLVTLHHNMTLNSNDSHWLLPVTRPRIPWKHQPITPTITNLNLSELRTMNHDTATAVSATATRWEQREAREWERKGQDREDKQQKQCHTYLQTRQDMLRFVRRGGWREREKEAKQVEEWPGRQRESECWQCCCVLVVPARLSGYLR